MFSTKRLTSQFFAISTLIVGGAMCTACPIYAGAPENLDDSKIERVSIHGASGRVELNARSDATPAVHIAKAGFFQLCRTQVEIRTLDATLDIAIKQTGMDIFGQCDQAAMIDLPANLAVSLDLPSTVLKLRGAFTDVSVASANATVDFSGHAQHFNMVSENAAVELAFTDISATDTIRIAADRLVANLGFQKGDRISYDVSASASVFTHAFANTPGAKPRVEITSKLLQGSIYILGDAS